MDIKLNTLMFALLVSTSALLEQNETLTISSTDISASSTMASPMPSATPEGNDTRDPARGWLIIPLAALVYFLLIMYLLVYRAVKRDESRSDPESNFDINQASDIKGHMWYGTS